jgi:ADP-ribose pyrophosphatase
MLDTPWMRVVSKRVVRPGAPSEDYLVVDTGDWAVICPRTADGRFVMVEQFRPAVEHRLLEFPAGRIDPGETAAVSIRRELREETGYNARRLMPLGSYFGDTGRLSNRAHLFYGEVEVAERWTPEPDLTVKRFTAGEIDRMVTDGGIAGLHHVALWLVVKAAGLGGSS